MKGIQVDDLAYTFIMALMQQATYPSMLTGTENSAQAAQGISPLSLDFENMRSRCS